MTAASLAASSGPLKDQAANAPPILPRYPNHRWRRALGPYIPLTNGQPRPSASARLRRALPRRMGMRAGSPYCVCRHRSRSRLRLRRPMFSSGQPSPDAGSGWNPKSAGQTAATRPWCRSQLPAAGRTPPWSPLCVESSAATPRAGPLRMKCFASPNLIHPAIRRTIFQTGKDQPLT